MNPEVENSVLKLLERARSDGKIGERFTLNKLDHLNKVFRNKLPEWLKQFYRNVPIYGLEITTKYIDSEDDEDYIDMGFLDLEGIISESTELYPGITLLDKGYLCIGYDALGTGDQIYISLEEGENPPVYQIYHDVSEQQEEILSTKRLIANSLSELFKNAKIT
ncbi:SMI1/KNR4 family protein [Bacillus sp. AFS029533]|uniref:SMI1/KNR4 family protein n=1 Tax=Bacillus sp. AFS029533 TaxID=2033494 RepID=UPI0015D498D9|nr:SMI1/KNR4 family protein [Bacillus sp. AFS029533]